MKGKMIWRRKRDSNPRATFAANGFQDRRLQPLGHSSISNCTEFPPRRATPWKKAGVRHNFLKPGKEVATGQLRIWSRWWSGG